MIRRRDNPRQLITQTAHSWLAGQFALHWGNERFRIPALRQELVLAATVHDQGWFDWEETPQVDGGGRPVDFLEMPLPVHLRIWERSIRRTAAQDRYAGVLVSMHARHLVGGRLKRAEDTETGLTRMRAFCERWEAWETETLDALQADSRLSAGCAAHVLEANLRLLQIFDWLSLLVCMSRLEESVVVDVPGDSPNRRTEIRLRPTGAQSFTVEPWPFGVARFPVTVEVRHLPQATFADDAAFGAAWRLAGVEPLVLWAER